MDAPLARSAGTGDIALYSLPEFNKLRRPGHVRD